MSDLRYPIVCIDLDHTLLDSDTSEAVSYDETLRAAGVADPGAHLEAFLSINQEMWAAVERGEIGASDVRLTRFERFVAARPLDADPAFLAERYATGLAANGELLPGALDMLDDLAGAVGLALVTNGVSDIQRTRIDRLGLGRYFDVVVISSEIGVSKPGAGFFDRTLELLGSPSRSDVLMVGDSLSSDMRGGLDYGLDTCWFNPAGRLTDLPVTHQIGHLAELPTIVRGS